MNIETRLALFVENLSDHVKAQLAPSTYDDIKFEAMLGNRYARIVRTVWIGSGRASRCAYCFIDLKNGDMLRTGTWKAPAKNAVRGNIFAPDFGLSRCDVSGLKYIRG